MRQLLQQQLKQPDPGNEQQNQNLHQGSEIDLCLPRFHLEHLRSAENLSLLEQQQTGKL